MKKILFLIIYFICGFFLFAEEFLFKEFELGESFSIGFIANEIIFFIETS